jgi:hypothetical protein
MEPPQTLGMTIPRDSKWANGSTFFFGGREWWWVHLNSTGAEVPVLRTLLSLTLCDSAYSFASFITSFITALLLPMTLKQ